MPTIKTIIFVTGLSIKKSVEIPIINHIIINDPILVFKGVFLLLLKFLIYFPNILWLISQKYIFCELLANKPADNNIKGVVGKPGTNIPITPKDNENNPSIINVIFNIFFIA